MTGRLIFAAGLLVGSSTGAVLTAVALRDDPTPEPAPALSPAQQVEHIPIEVSGVAGTCEVTYLDGRLTEIECAPTKEPVPRSPDG